MPLLVAVGVGAVRTDPVPRPVHRRPVGALIALQLTLFPVVLIADYIKDVTDTWSISPIVLAWLIAVILRVALGSATVAVVTASGVVLPLLAVSGVHPEILVLAVSCGSIAFSHVNDPGFWLFKEYFNLRQRSDQGPHQLSTVLAILGPGGVLAVEWALDILNL
ncbi:GntT/GntP/DsdX family permease [Streptomyces niveus]|uniref:GntT/GntP/DsdX family permease n=1 Tax=Streptomyces niveus TaxID=193462 RepID=UPI0036738B51